MNVEKHTFYVSIVNNARHINCGLFDFCKLPTDCQRTDMFLALTDKCKSNNIFYMHAIKFISPYTMAFNIILHHTFLPIAAFLFHIHRICDHYLIKVMKSIHVRILFTENKEKTLSVPHNYL